MLKMSFKPVDNKSFFFLSLSLVKECSVEYDAFDGKKVFFFNFATENHDDNRM